MTVLAAYVSSSPAKAAALARVSLRPATAAQVGNIDVVAGLEHRTVDLMDIVRRVAEELPSRRPHSDQLMFSPAQRARNIAMSYLAAVSDARRADLRTFDGHLVEMKSRMPGARNVSDAVEALNARRTLLAIATSELENLVAAVARDDLQAAEEHRVTITEECGAAIPSPERPMTTFDYLVQRSASIR